MDLGTFVRVLVRNWWLILLAVVVTAGSTAYFVSRATPVYRGATTVEVKPSEILDESRDVIDVLNSLERRTTINTIARKVTSSSLQEKVANTLNLATEVVSGAELTAIVEPEANLIQIRAVSTNPETAAAITNAVAEELGKQLPEKVLQMDIIDRATPPVTPIEPKPVQTITLSVLFGIAIGIGFALLQHATATRIVSNRSTSAVSTIVQEDQKFETEREDSQLDTNRTQPIFTR